jgi:hypothetical protein
MRLHLSAAAALIALSMCATSALAQQVTKDNVPGIRNLARV